MKRSSLYNLPPQRTGKYEINQCLRLSLQVRVGYWLLAIGYWLLAIGYWLLAIGYWLLLAIGYLLTIAKAARRRPLVLP
jgi:hypothetical protein